MFIQIHFNVSVLIIINILSFLVDITSKFRIISVSTNLICHFQCLYLLPMYFPLNRIENYAVHQFYGYSTFLTSIILVEALIFYQMTKICQCSIIQKKFKNVKKKSATRVDDEEYECDIDDASLDEEEEDDSGGNISIDEYRMDYTSEGYGESDFGNESSCSMTVDESRREIKCGWFKNIILIIDRITFIVIVNIYLYMIIDKYPKIKYIQF